jgi:hypothetical protein
MGSHGTLSKIVSSHGMQWDISKIFRPMGRDTFQKLFIPWDGILFKNFSSHGMGYISKISIHPIPWDVILLKNVPWDGMGWDGMGRDGIIPSHAEPWYVSLYNSKNILCL